MTEKVFKVRWVTYLPSKYPSAEWAFEYDGFRTTTIALRTPIEYNEDDEFTTYTLESHSFIYHEVFPKQDEWLDKVVEWAKNN